MLRVRVCDVVLPCVPVEFVVFFFLKDGPPTEIYKSPRAGGSRCEKETDSEQVESIQEGPLEAVTATGATRLQTIVYAVIPQIVPPYISFTLYRWDINVRMSTIIGFAGGGGIGFLLQQNINLLQYRQASVQMLAIAVVVASLDYLSAAIREHYV